jgi:hypothetical protein
MTWFTVTEYLCHKWPQICSACCNHNPILSSFMTYHRVCDKSNMTGATYGAWTAYPSCAPDHEFTPQVFSGICVAWSLVFCVRFCRLLFVLFLLAIALSVLWFTASDCPFGIFWTLCCLSCDLRLLIAPLVSFGHCVVCPVIYCFWLPLWYLQTFLLSVPVVLKMIIKAVITHPNLCARFLILLLLNQQQNYKIFHWKFIEYCL